MSATTTVFTRDRAASRPFVIAMSVIGSVLLVSAAVIANAVMSRVPPEEEPATTKPPVLQPGAEESGQLELEMEAEALRLENSLLREGGKRIEADDGPPENDLSVVPTIKDPGAAEAVEVALALRREGDMKGALEQLRSAQTIVGNHPRILYAMADAHQAMGLNAKANQEWELIRDIGPAAGDYYEMAVLRLGYTDPSFTPARPDTALFIGSAGIQRDEDFSDGENIAVRLSLQSRATGPLEVPKVYIDVQFYDLINGREVDVNRSKENVRFQWSTQPVNWNENEELLDITYVLPEALAKRNPGERRQYYGFVAKLYYKDQLQDVYMHPRTLHEDILDQTELKSREADASLFPE
ncbi:MAG: hypothetical protein AAGA58_13045 [Verrucomicrobiota bacterium]